MDESAKPVTVGRNPVSRGAIVAPVVGGADRVEELAVGTLALDPVSILLYGDSGDGKTTLLAELAKHLYRTEKKKTILFAADRGGMRPLAPLARLGVVEVVDLDEIIWIWLHHAAAGERRTAKGWQSVITPEVGLLAYEGLTAYAEQGMRSLADLSAKNINVGGEGAWNVTIAGETEQLVMGSNNKAHYGLVQMRLAQEICDKQRKVPTLWTALVRRAGDQLGGTTGVLGPFTIGDSQTASLPRWFDYTFRVLGNPQTAKHTLCLEQHIDALAVRAKGLGNARLPLEGATVAPVAKTIEPASLVRALWQIKQRERAAEAQIRQELGL